MIQKPYASIVFIASILLACPFSAFSAYPPAGTDESRYIEAQYIPGGSSRFQDVVIGGETKIALLLGTWQFNLTGQTDATQFKFFPEPNGNIDFSANTWTNRIVEDSSVPEWQQAVIPSKLVFVVSEGTQVIDYVDLWSTTLPIPELVLSPGAVKIFTAKLYLVITDSSTAYTDLYVKAMDNAQITWRLWDSNNWYNTIVPVAGTPSGTTSPLIPQEWVKASDGFYETPYADEEDMLFFQFDFAAQRDSYDLQFYTGSTPQPVADASATLSGGKKTSYDFFLEFNPQDFVFKRNTYTIGYSLWYQDPGTQQLSQITQSAKKFSWDGLSNGITTSFFGILQMSDVNVTELQYAPAGQYTSTIHVTITPKDSI